MGSGLADCWVSGDPPPPPQPSCNIEEGENSFVRGQNNIPFGVSTQEPWADSHAEDEEQEEENFKLG